MISNEYISGIIPEALCIPKINARSKKEALMEIADYIAVIDSSISNTAIFEGLLSREQQGSTAFGDKVAIPHCKINGMKDFLLSIAISRKGIDFNAPDRKKIKIIFIIIGPDNRPDDYIKILANVTRIAKSEYARTELLLSKTSETIRESFLKYLPSNQSLNLNRGLDQKLLIVTLSELNYFEDIVEILLSMGISGGLVLESSTMKTILSEVPLFSQILNFTGERQKKSKTILSVVDSEQINSVISEIETIIGNLDNHSGAVVFAVNLSFSKGSLDI